MGIAVLILGESGSGKSTSLRNFKNDEVGVINVSGKPLPFRTDIKTYNNDNSFYVLNAVKEAKRNAVVIDDSQYLLANEFMRRANEKGYEKFTDIGKNYWELIRAVAELPDDKIVYFLSHTDTDDTGRVKAKTIGKLLDDKITVEGMFSIVLRTQVLDGRYIFRTQTNGNDTVKSPMGLFKTMEIDNDLKAVDAAIREYYGLQGLKGTGIDKKEKGEKE